MGREQFAQETGDEAAEDWAACKRATGGGGSGGGRKFAGGFVRLELGPQRLRGEEEAVGGGGTGVKKGVEPKS